MRCVDPTADARDWLAANPGHEVAVHVRQALASADRYERLAVAMEAATGHHVIIATLDGKGGVTLTSPSRIEEQRVAELVGGYLVLLESVRVGMEREKAEAMLVACDDAEGVIREWRSRFAAAKESK